MFWYFYFHSVIPNMGYCVSSDSVFISLNGPEATSPGTLSHRVSHKKGEYPRIIAQGKAA